MHRQIQQNHFQGFHILEFYRQRHSYKVLGQPSRKQETPDRMLGKWWMCSRFYEKEQRMVERWNNEKGKLSHNFGAQDTMNRLWSMQELIGNIGITIWSRITIFGNIQTNCSILVGNIKVNLWKSNMTLINNFVSF